MATIINSERKFAFVHIPKCGGTSVFTQLLKLGCFDPRFVNRIETLPDGRTVVMDHAPLAPIAEHFPDAFEEIDRFSAFAVTREPKARFRSALTQHVREFSGRDVQALPIEEVRTIAREVVARLSADPILPGRAYIHFVRQIDFVQHEGRQVVDRLFPLSALNRLIEEISAVADAELEPEAAANRSYAYRSRLLGRVLPKLSRTAAAILPKTTVAAVRDTLRPALQRPATAGPAGVLDQVVDSEEITAFIEAFYADDVGLHESATAAQSRD